MKGVLKFAIPGVISSALLGVAGAAQAQTLLNAASPTAFTFGNQTFTITGCLINGATCASTTTEVVSQFSGRGGTEIEIKSTGSYIYSGTGSYTLSFNLAVTPLAGTAGISKITDLLTASDTSSAGNSDVYASVTGNSPSTFAQIKSTIAGNAAPQSFTLVQNPNTANFTINLGVTATAGQTLSLANVALLFNPAPEPASLALLATGLAGMTVARRRFASRSRRNLSASFPGS